MSHVFAPEIGYDEIESAQRWIDKKISIKTTLMMMASILSVLLVLKIGTVLLAPSGHGGGEEMTAVKVEGLVVNLQEDEEMHYLKSSFEIEPVDHKETAKLQGKISLIRHEMMLYMSSLSVADTQGEKNKAAIRDNMLKRLELALRETGIKIHHLYFTEFVVQ